MKITVFGATGKTGLAIVDQALSRGHCVTSYARSNDSLGPFEGRIETVVGTLEGFGSISNAVSDSDCVICALGTIDRKPNTVLSDGTKTIIDAMHSQSVRRFVAITSFGCRESVDLVPSFIFRELIVKRMAKNIWADKNRQEEIIEQSGLDYTIARPGGLTDKPGTGSYQALPQHQKPPKKIMVSRADVAKFLLDAMVDDQTIRKIYTIIS